MCILRACSFSEKTAIFQERIIPSPLSWPRSARDQKLHFRATRSKSAHSEKRQLENGLYQLQAHKSKSTLAQLKRLLWSNVVPNVASMWNSNREEDSVRFSISWKVLNWPLSGSRSLHFRFSTEMQGSKGRDNRRSLLFWSDLLISANLDWMRQRHVQLFNDNYFVQDVSNR